VLFEGLSRFKRVRVLFGHTVETVEEDAHGVTAVALFSAADGGGERRFRAQYLVGGREIPHPESAGGQLRG
jgi:3-(3-hydroxy-phenyl)propionate hydroxylase